MNNFDHATHTYTINGRKVPSVTQVLNDLLPGFKASDWHKQRGSTVHACAAMVARGEEFELDLSAQTPDDKADILGRIEAVRRFFREVKPVVIFCETPAYSERYQYAGTLDLLATINGQWLIMDWKPGETPALPYQLAAYSLINTPPVSRGCGVLLSGDGRYSMTKVFDLRRYQQGFLALLTAYNIRRNAGIKEGEAV